MTETNEATAPTMRAMTYDTYGGPENLALTEQPRPKVGPGEVLVRVRSASVNPVDWKLMSGGLDAVMDVRFPVVPGWDVAGVVEAVGFDTPEFSPGDEVLAYARKDYVHGGTFAELVAFRCGPWPPSRHRCRGTRQPACRSRASRPSACCSASRSARATPSWCTPPPVASAPWRSRSPGRSAPASSARRPSATTTASVSSGPSRWPTATGSSSASGRWHPRVWTPSRTSSATCSTSRPPSSPRAAATAPSPTPRSPRPGATTSGCVPTATRLAHLTRLVEGGALSVPVAQTFPLEQLADAFRLSAEGHTAGKIVVRVSTD